MFFIRILFLYLFFISICTADEINTDSGTLCNPKIYFSYGPGGPIRKQFDCFAGETIYMIVEIPKALTGIETDLFCDGLLTSQINKNRRISNPKPISFQGFSLRDHSSFFYLTLTIPIEFEEGIYDFQIIVRNKTGTILSEGKKTINLHATSSYGMRNLMFLHGIPQTSHWLPGSNVYKAGETVKIKLDISGLSVNKDEEVEAMIRLILVDSEGNSVNVMDSILKSRISMFDRSKIWNFSHEFIMAQPGDYSLKIEIEDMNSQKKDSCKLPLLIIDPVRLSNKCSRSIK